MSNHAEVLIIGAGIIGCATAYYLAKKGISVLVLEGSDSIGDGGSSRNGGGVRQSGRDPRELPIVMYGIRHIWPNLKDELGVDVEYYQEGNLRLGKTEAHLKILEVLTQRSVQCGLDVKMISGVEAREICPYLSDSVLGASWCPTDGHANPLLATLAFYRRARQLGARFITGEKVAEIRKLQGAARQVVTQNNVFEGDRIIVAAGMESRPILNTVGIDVPMTPLLLETLVTEAVEPMFYQMLGTAAADFYGHQSTHGSFVFGTNSGLEPYAKPGKTVSSSVSASAACRGILSYFPVLADLKIIRTWAGWIDSCADHVPVISPVEEVPGLIVACGFTGHGFGIAPPVGMLLSELATGSELTLDLSDLRYDRFKAR
ncbi:FAD-binding oxidoreductase [Desulfosporosinus sp. OT]|uniref:NAD(P)/FAD-dependent oxidoreductase n=1 Tax=Desulfosporosinus sp. OT TaxID=913865 RepID=UPI000223B22E|nr:FAD-binding oxidoreductase [Desulfosporosinus sp. OT]EGW38782.1 FAD dependent oxidoreductase family protein [Desulfosporosinus sp. OT]